MQKPDTGQVTESMSVVPVPRPPSTQPVLPRVTTVCPVPPTAQKVSKQPRDRGTNPSTVGVGLPHGPSVLSIASKVMRAMVLSVYATQHHAGPQDSATICGGFCETMFGLGPTSRQVEPCSSSTEPAWSS